MTNGTLAATTILNSTNSINATGSVINGVGFTNGVVSGTVMLSSLEDNGASLGEIMVWNGMAWVAGGNYAEYFIYTTNAHTGVVLDLAKPYQLFSIGANVTLTGLANTSDDFVKHSVLMLTNATANVYSVTLPTPWRTSDGLRTYYVTNGQMAILSVNCYAKLFTNAVCVNTW
jgi:hypothetical protein